MKLYADVSCALLWMKQQRDDRLAKGFWLIFHRQMLPSSMAAPSQPRLVETHRYLHGERLQDLQASTPANQQ